LPTYLRRHIMLRKEYADMLLSGKKRATVRLGKVIPKYREVIVHSGGKPICKVRITRVTHKKVSELTDEDARKDGFESRRELLKELKKVYGKRLSGDEEVTIIEFEVLQRLDHLSSEDPYLGLKPEDIARLALRYLRSEFPKDERRILEELGKGKSIREVAKELTGDPTRRWRVRGVLRKALKLLVDKGILTPHSQGEGTEK